MGRFLTCSPLHCHSDKHQDSDQSQTNESSSNSSLTSQLSLPSLPSLNPHSQTLEHATSAAAAHHGSATLKGHSSYIFSLSLAGKHLYSGASNGEIRVWDRNPYSPHGYNHVVAEGYSAVKSMVVSGDKLITAHQDHRIRVWKINDDVANYPHKYRLITTLPTVHDRCMRFLSPKNYVEIRRHKKCTWVHHVDTVSALALSRDNAVLYSVSWDRSLKIWRTRDFKCVESVQNAHDDAINAVVLSPDGDVYTGSADKSIKVWRKSEGKTKHSLVRTLEKHRSGVNALALSGDGSVLYSGACDRSVIVWENGAAAGALRGHRKAILCLAVVADLVCSGSADKTVRVWRRGSGNSYSCLAVFEGHTRPVKCLTAAVDNSSSDKNELGISYLVYSGALDFDIRVWQLRVPL